MKVKELIKSLQELDPEAVVILSRDSEGNGYGECEAVETGCFVDGHDFKYDRTEELDMDPEDTAVPGENGAVKCVTLWP